MKKFMDFVPVLLCVFLVTGTAIPLTAKVSPYVYHVRKLLQKNDKPSKSRLLWVSQNAPKILLDLATDRKESNLVRTRAIRALMLFKTYGIFKVLRAMIFDPLEPKKVRAAAMSNIGGFHGRHVVGILKQFILSPTDIFRVSAATGLAKLSTHQACAVIRAALIKETDLETKMGLDNLYEKCIKRGGK